MSEKQTSSAADEIRQRDELFDRIMEQQAELDSKDARIKELESENSKMVHAHGEAQRECTYYHNEASKMREAIMDFIIAKKACEANSSKLLRSDTTYHDECVKLMENVEIAESNLAMTVMPIINDKSALQSKPRNQEL